MKPHRCIGSARRGVDETRLVIRGPSPKPFTSCTDHEVDTRSKVICVTWEELHIGLFLSPIVFTVKTCLHAPLPCGMSPDRQWGVAGGGVEWQGQASARPRSSPQHTTTTLQTSKRLLLKLKMLKLGQRKSLFSHFGKKKVL